MQLLQAPQFKPIDKDAVIEDLKRKLLATEYQRDIYKENWIDSSKKEYEYYCKLEKLGEI